MRRVQCHAVASTKVPERRTGERTIRQRPAVMVMGANSLSDADCADERTIRRRPAVVVMGVRLIVGWGLCPACGGAAVEIVDVTGVVVLLTGAPTELAVFASWQPGTVAEEMRFFTMVLKGPTTWL